MCAASAGGCTLEGGRDGCSVCSAWALFCGLMVRWFVGCYKRAVIRHKVLVCTFYDVLVCWMVSALARLRPLVYVAGVCGIVCNFCQSYVTHVCYFCNFV